MSVTAESPSTTKTVKLGKKEYELSKITMGIWAAFEAQSGILEPGNLSIEERVKKPIDYLQTTNGRLALLTLCINKNRKPKDHITVEELGSSLELSDIVDVINAIGYLMKEANPAQLPDGKGWEF